MLRFLTVFILFFAMSFAAPAPIDHPYNSSCMALNCAKSGASCTGDFFQKNFTFCLEQAFLYKQPTGCCPVGLYCLTGSGNSSSFTCMKDNSGATCSTDADCFASLTGTNYMQCVSSKCQIVYGAGDSCSTGTDCYSTAGVGKGTCTSDVCAGVAEGGDCSDVNNPLPKDARVAICNPGFYCEAGLNPTCKPVLAEGAACTAVSTGGTPCPAGQWCAGNPGKCTPVGSVGSNGATFATGGVPDTYLCSSGMAANASGICVTGKSYTLTSCSNDTDCTSVDADSKCECSPNGKGYCTLELTPSMAPSDTGVSEGVSLLQCLANNNCSYDYLTPDGFNYANNDPNSCAVKKCNSDLKKFMAADCNVMKASGSCVYMPYCSGFPVWAIIVIVVVAILLVLAVVFVIFLVLRKRRDYSSI